MATDRLPLLLLLKLNSHTLFPIFLNFLLFVFLYDYSMVQILLSNRINTLSSLVHKIFACLFDLFLNLLPYLFCLLLYFRLVIHFLQRFLKKLPIFDDPRVNIHMKIDSFLLVNRAVSVVVVLDLQYFKPSFHSF